ncbi:MAG: NAD(P)/FAD-dependent oxidoreductase [Kamptonema sp. SIO4C4]|nr:NAD(P)/FAD-dependent oxidoreductase [Kamptonema sp. SIO4C4]
MGGLTTAVLLAKRLGQRVLVLEQHFKIGGFTHIFQRQGKYHWDVGLHYVGQMGKGETPRQIMDYLTNGQVEWQPMPEPFEQFVYPDFTFPVYGDKQRYQGDLIALFPQEEAAIKRYFQDIGKASSWAIIPTMVANFAPGWLNGLLQVLLRPWGRIARQTTGEYLDRHFQSEQLKAILASQWGDYGLPPSQSAFGVHATIVSHYLNGGWYPVGSASALAEAMMPIIQEAGGQCLTQQSVTEILVQNGTAYGVKAKNRKGETVEYHAPIIVSDAGAYNTYCQFLPDDIAPNYQQQIKKFPQGTSALTLYLGLQDSPRSLGFQGENHWIYNSYNHDESFAQAWSNPDTPPSGCYLSFPSLKNTAAEHHTAEIIAFANYDHFARWQETRWRKRGEDYQELKSQLSEQMIDLVEARYPGFRDLIEYQELSTPLTVEYFENSDRGAIYGLPATPQRFQQPWAKAKTPVKNLYLTGADSLMLGIMGATMAGLTTTAVIEGGGPHFAKIMTAIKQEAAQKDASPNSEFTPHPQQG